MARGYPGEDGSSRPAGTADGPGAAARADRRADSASNGERDGERDDERGDGVAEPEKRTGTNLRIKGSR
ncbi:hypothetical protein [Streptomyces sp. NPDC059134]|uniref:hypothetical protein n=1 Tax=Streptomyces sp. NPDC059134 TaxID=3346738 RepID=UPI0036B6BFFB